MSSSIYRAVNTTLIYIECGGEYLMLHRTKKENDCNCLLYTSPSPRD